MEISPETRQLAARFLNVLESLRKIAPYKIDHELADKLHVNHWRILLTIYHQPGIVQKVLAERLGITPAAVSTAIRQLEALHLVERYPDPDDHRLLHLQLSERGRAILQTMQEARTTSVARLLAALPLERQHLIVEALEEALQAHINETDTKRRGE